MQASVNQHAIVEMAGVTKRYGASNTASVALRNLDLRIDRGEFVSLMGPSGSGKSTLLNLVAGLDAPNEGRVLLCGRDLATLRDHEIAALRLRTVGFIFQAFNLIPAFTVYDNVAWPLEYSGCSSVETRQRVAQALARVGVLNREQRYPGELAGGEQQRVAIARAIATAPTLLLADEPTGNLDSQTGRLILDLLRVLNHEERVTIIMVTHNVFAATYGDRTLEIRDGQIIRDIRTPSRLEESETNEVADG